MRGLITRPGFLIHLQNFIVNQIHFITFGGGYIWEGRLQVVRLITWEEGWGGASKHSKHLLMIPVVCCL